MFGEFLHFLLHLQILFFIGRSFIVLATLTVLIIALIKEYLEENTTSNIVMMNGTIKDEVRAKALKDIRETPNTIMIAQSSMSAGWETLISSATMFVSVKRWRHYHQGMGRNSRHQNETEQKNVYRMYLGPVSTHIWEDIIDMRKNFNDELK